MLTKLNHEDHVTSPYPFLFNAVMANLLLYKTSK
jgi:hypothetical protein